MKPVPVLMYHHVNPHKGDLVTIRPEVFEGQIRYLHESGYKTLKIDELLSYMAGELTFTEKAVVVTFDDGWLDNYIYAYPVIKEFRINATIFLVTDRSNGAAANMAETVVHSVPTHKDSKLLIKKGEEHKVVLNWALINEMAVAGLVDFYSHTKSHKKCDRLTENELLEELFESKHIIEEKIGRACPYLCWPYGKYNKTALKIARSVGYKALFTTQHGVVNVGSDPFAIRRIVVKDDVAWFKKRMLVYTNSIISKLYLKIKKK
jgi:peptidoglycan/xylan/chitin deacetylase (PgdA/CDA1 family)